MDELAYAVGVDPLELRLRNYAESEPSSGKPWSSKRLREAYALAAERFGWSRREMQPCSMRERDWQIGWGLATASYPGHLEAAKASAARLADGTFAVRSATHDMGTGTYTVMTQVAADTLGVPIERVRFELGDTRLPQAPTSGGSMTVASVGPAVVAACQALRAKLAELSGESGPPYRVVEAHGEAKPRSEEDEQPFAVRSFGAVFVEVRLDRALGVLRVPRIVAAYSVGRVLNLKTATNQLSGGIVMGIGQALLEETYVDARNGRVVNANLAEYHVPVNADVGEIDVSFVEENDTRFNSLGARGIGEIGITGVAAALANAVFHATGRRIRGLPITLEKLL
jgi:xanthine dehydrogenase YagR molybdenum-binding subunit